MIDPTALIDYDHVIIGNCVAIGKDVVIERNTTIGNNVTIEDGAVIGSEGFEFRRLCGEVLPVYHAGGVIIRDNVRIGYRVCIDKSMLDPPTEIGCSTVLKAEVHVGHGVIIGHDAVLEEGTMIGGYARIGNYVRIGQDCSLADAISLDDHIVIPARTVLSRNVLKSGAPEETVS